MTEILITQNVITPRICVENSKLCVRIGSATPDCLPITSGVKLTDVMSPEIFIIAPDKAVGIADTRMQMFSADEPKLLIALTDDIDVIPKIHNNTLIIIRSI